MSKTVHPNAAAAESKLLSSYADDIALIADEEPATTLEDFVRQLSLASIVLAGTNISGSADLDTAANTLAQLTFGGWAQQRVLLELAADQLRGVGELADEYRLKL